MYVIIRGDGLWYVAGEGTCLGYTDCLQEAQRYHNRASAQYECCLSERVVDLRDLPG